MLLALGRHGANSISAIGIIADCAHLYVPSLGSAK
jgi:hypothetical protein